MSSTMYAPFSVEGMTPEEEETWDMKVERSLGNLVNGIVKEEAPTGVLKTLLDWLDIQEEEYAYEKSLIERELYLRGEF